MIINKAQGQTLERVGIDLQYEVFSHGQLYVAMSRARSWSSVSISLGEGIESRLVKNIVYEELFDKVEKSVQI